MDEKKRDVEKLVMGLSNVTVLQQSNVFKKSAYSVNIRRVGTSLFITNQPRAKAEKKELNDAQLRGLRSDKYTGRVTATIKKRIMSICQNWSDTLDFMNGSLSPGEWRERREIVLITLTLSATQIHDDKWIKRNMLNKFMISFLRGYPNANYLWKAEKQKNGNLHFHILTDVYVDKAWLQKRWNLVQFHAGYHPQIDIVSDDLGLPSTRVEGLRDKNNSIAYIAKYMSKDDDDNRIDGRVWACNKQLTNLEVITLQTEKKSAVVLAESVMTEKSEVLVYDYVTILTNVKSTFYIRDFIRTDHLALSRMIFNSQQLNPHQLTNKERLSSEEWFRELENDYQGSPEII